MEGNDAGLWPLLDERQKMNRDVAEIDMQQIRALCLEDADELRDFAAAKSSRERRVIAGTKSVGGNASPVSERR